MRRLGVSRRDLFLELDSPALKALPAEPYEYADGGSAASPLIITSTSTAHYYSVPYRLIREQLDARITAHTVELFRKGERVAVHLRGAGRGRHTTIAEHMPQFPSAIRRVDPRAHSHRRGSGWSQHRQADRANPGEQAAPRAGLSGLHWHPSFGAANTVPPGWKRLATAVVDIGARSYGSIQSILKHGLDKQPTRAARQGELLPDHPNIRGSRYYH